MVARVWHGYTTLEKADAYHKVLTTEVIPGIAAMKLPGFHSIQVLRRKLTDEVEFITVMWFDALENIKSFTGDDYEVAHVPAPARAVLKRFDDRSQHYDLVHERNF